MHPNLNKFCYEDIVIAQVLPNQEFLLINAEGRVSTLRPSDGETPWVYETYEIPLGDILDVKNSGKFNEENTLYEILIEGEMYCTDLKTYKEGLPKNYAHIEHLPEGSLLIANREVGREPDILYGAVLQEKFWKEVVTVMGALRNEARGQNGRPGKFLTDMNAFAKSSPNITVRITTEVRRQDAVKKFKERKDPDLEI